MWVRGLKLLTDVMSSPHLNVAPYVGAWIETQDNLDTRYFDWGRTLCGCVD